MSLSELEQQNKFKKHLGQYWSSKGITQIKIPQIGGQQLNLFKLYKAVCKKGGGQAVSHNKLWKQIVDQFGLPSTCTSASFTLKNHYQKYLLGYQQRFFFGKDDTADLPQLVAGRQRKPMKQGEGMISSRFGSYRPQGQTLQSTLASQLKRYYQKSDPNQHINYIKRTKIYPVMSQVKHMILAFYSPHNNQSTFAINMFLLFSMNTQAPLLFSQYPNILQSVSYFIEHHFPYKTIFQLECLRTLTLGLRNLLINHKNLQPFLESPLVDVLQRIFQAHNRQDLQLIRNITDIFASLSRIGWDCRQLFQMISLFLQREKHQDLQTGIDLLRSLVQQKQQQCQQILCTKQQLFIRCLLHSSIQVRESVLQIFAYMTQKSQRVRIVYIKQMKFVQRLIGLMSTSQGVLEKQAQLACLIVNNFLQLYTGENEEMRELFLQKMRPFEQHLALVSFNDESLSPITSSILFYLSGRVQSGTAKDIDREKLLDKMRKNIDRDRVSSQQEQEQQEQEQEEQEQQQEIDEQQQEQQLLQQEQEQQQQDMLLRQQIDQPLVRVQKQQQQQDQSQQEQDNQLLQDKQLLNKPRKIHHNNQSEQQLIQNNNNQKQEIYQSPNININSYSQKGRRDHIQGDDDDDQQNYQ